MTTLSPGQLALAPLGAGDLIDRAVRLYRRHLFVLIRTAAPPCIIAAAGWILFSISIRRIFISSETDDLFILFPAVVPFDGIMLGGYLFIVVVMGGATRTLVAHLLRNDPVTARATYAAVRSRFWGLRGRFSCCSALDLCFFARGFVGWANGRFYLCLGAMALANCPDLAGHFSRKGSEILVTLAFWLLAFLFRCGKSGLCSADHACGGQRSCRSRCA